MPLNLRVLLFTLVVSVEITHQKDAKADELAHLQQDEGRTILLENVRRRCPLCDSSVFSYCSDKLFHDSCCCNNPNNAYYPLPPQCQFADCSFLHANSCHEHKLITACCCISHLNILIKK